MSSDAICTLDEITALVHDFYAVIRQDALLGPIFNAHVSDWDTHLGRMVSFWSSTLLGDGSYRGTPMARHTVLPDLDAGLFRHWLGLFYATTAALPNQALRARADELANRIAQSLWYGYQIHNAPHGDPDGLGVQRSAEAR